MNDASTRHYHSHGMILCLDHAPAIDDDATTERFYMTARERFYMAKELGSRVICDHCRESAAK
jgi:hypothetical protein